jgi:HK97 family phage portal protein
MKRAFGGLYRLVNDRPGGIWGGTVHEPFTGGWQRNIECRPETLACFSAVYASINIISSDIAKLPLRLKRTSNGVSRTVNSAGESPYYSVVRKPNSYQSTLDFIAWHMTCKLTTGNSYILIKRDARRVPIELHVLHPEYVQPQQAPDGSIFYQISTQPMAGITDSTIVPSRDIIHDRFQSMGHPLFGVSPIVASAYSAHAGLAILKNSNALFSNMARPSGILTSDGPISKDTAQRIADGWNRNYSGEGLGKTAVLGDGLKFAPISMTAQDAQLIDQLRFNVEDVARAFRVPLHMLGDLSKASFNNVENLNRQFYSSTLQFHIEALEACFLDGLELPSDLSIEFDLDSLFRSDTEARFGAYQQALASGWLSINEVRAKEGMQAIEGGEEPRVQAQYIPISQISQLAVQPSPAPVEQVPEENLVDLNENPSPTEELGISIEDDEFIMREIATAHSRDWQKDEQ